MAICMVFDMPGVTQQQYDAILEALGTPLGASPPPEAGHLMHIAGPSDGGWRVIEVWDSHDDANRFWQEKLGAALEQAGVAEPGPPQVFEVYNIEK